MGSYTDSDKSLYSSKLKTMLALVGFICVNFTPAASSILRDAMVDGVS